MRFFGSFVRVFIATVAGLALLGSSFFFGVRAYGNRRLTTAVDTFITEHGPLQPRVHNLAPVPAHLNAATWVLNGAQQLQLSNHERDMVSLAAVTPHASWPSETARVVPATVQRNRDAIAALIFASSLPESSYEVDYAHGHNSRLPPLLELLSSARLLAAAARQHAAEGQTDEARRCMVALAELARGLEREVHITLQQSGWTAENMLLRILSEQLERSGATILEDDPSVADRAPDVDIARQFDRFLAWRAASSAPLTSGPGPETRVWRPVAPPAGAWWMPLAQAMTREVWAATEIESAMVEINALQGPVRPVWNDPFPHDGVPGMTPVEMVSMRMRLIISSRHVVHSARQIRRLSWDTGDIDIASPTRDMPNLLTGGPVETRRLPDGSIRVEITGIDILAARVFPARLNPPPPLGVTVPSKG